MKRLILIAFLPMILFGQVTYRSSKYVTIYYDEDYEKTHTSVATFDTSSFVFRFTAIGKPELKIFGSTGLRNFYCDSVGNIVLLDDKSIGLGSGKALLGFDDQSTDYAYFSDCNVGIGTTEPGYKLEVAGGSINIPAAFTTAGASYRINTNDVMSQGGTGYSASSLVFNKSSLENVIIANGNVGIGTASPGAKLSVEGGNTNSGGIQLKSGATDWRIWIPATGELAIGGSAGTFFWYADYTPSGTSPSNLFTIPLLSATEGTTMAVRAITGQTGNLFEWQNSTPTVLGVIDSNGNIGIGTTAPDKKLVVWGGDQSIVDPTDLGSESLNETAFTTHANWDVTNDCNDEGGNATWSYVSGLASTLTQTSGNMAVAGVGNRWYKFTYTVSGKTGTPTASITTSFASSSTALTLTAGTQTTYFKSAASPGDFVITSTLTSGQAFVLDNVTLKEVQGGDINVHGKYCGGGASGLKIYANGNAIFDGNVYGATYGSDGSVSDAELKYINTLSSNAQTQLNGKVGTLEGWITAGSQNPTLGILPANAKVLSVECWVSELFDSDGADEITVGYDGAVTEYATAIDVSTAGIKTPTLGATAKTVDATSRSVEAYYTNGGSEPEQGKAHVSITYILCTVSP